MYIYAILILHIERSFFRDYERNDRSFSKRSCLCFKYKRRYGNDFYDGFRILFIIKTNCTRQIFENRIILKKELYEKCGSFFYALSPAMFFM